jgi:hypothetical protein
MMVNYWTSIPLQSAIQSRSRNSNLDSSRYCSIAKLSTIITNPTEFSMKIPAYLILCGGHAVAQLVETLRYKPEGRGFDSRWYHWNFSLT